jgi:hypothetical protein
MKSLRTPWRSEILSNRADSFFYSFVKVWSFVNALSLNENRTWCFWWDTLMRVNITHKSDLYTQSAMLTRMNVIMTLT